MTTPYAKEADHERAIIDRYEKKGMQGTRSAGSHGIADGIVWDDKDIIFFASQRVPWDLRKQELIWRSLKRPPNSHLLFFSMDEHGYEKIEFGDDLAEMHGWSLNNTTQELLEFAKKKNWKWVEIVHGPR
jgi:hypothetical protein